MLGVDDRLVTPDTMKWVKVGLISGLATVPVTIVLYYVLGMVVDSAYAQYLINTGGTWSGKEIALRPATW